MTDLYINIGEDFIKYTSPNYIDVFQDGFLNAGKEPQAHSTYEYVIGLLVYILAL